MGDLRRRGGPHDRLAGQPREFGRRKALHIAGYLILPDQALAEEQRVIRRERDRHARFEQRAHRNRGEIRFDTQRHVGGRANLKRDARLREVPHEIRVFHGTDSVPDACGVQAIQAGIDASRTDEFASVRGEQQPGPFGDAEGTLEVFGRAAPLVVRQAEADYPSARELGGEPGERARVHRMPRTVGGDDDRDRQARGIGGLLRRVHEQFGKRGDTAVPGGEAGWIGLEFEPA